MTSFEESQGGARVLIVDDEQEMCTWLETSLRRRGFTASWRTSAEEALELLSTEDLDVLVADIHMRGMDGIELCRRAALVRPDLPVVVLTGFGSLETAVAAIRAGAYDFITKPVEIDALVIALARAATYNRLRREVGQLRRTVAEADGFQDLLGKSPAMKKVYALLQQVAESDATVLITGESGTGKELIARALHRAGSRSAGPFVAVNCSAVPEPLFESELFGHVKGAFNDAQASRAGQLVTAHGGTLFLDEIGELPLATQPKLLRALQERAVRPVGGAAPVPFEARIIAATNRDLESAVEERLFREDLYYRINVIHIEIPPLRSRGADVLLLAQHFLDRLAKRSGLKPLPISTAAAERLMSYVWPGNVRELENCMERAVVVARGAELAVDDLPEKIRGYRPAHVLVVSEDPAELVSLDEVERRYIQRVLQAVSGNKTAAARILGLDRKTLRRKLGRSHGSDSQDTD